MNIPNRIQIHVSDINLENSEKERMEYEQQYEDEFNKRMWDLYEYDEDGFCDGFAKY